MFCSHYPFSHSVIFSPHYFQSGGAVRCPFLILKSKKKHTIRSSLIARVLTNRTILHCDMLCPYTSENLNLFGECMSEHELLLAVQPPLLFGQWNIEVRAVPYSLVVVVWLWSLVSNRHFRIILYASKNPMSVAIAYEQLCTLCLHTHPGVELRSSFSLSLISSGQPHNANAVI